MGNDALPSLVNHKSSAGFYHTRDPTHYPGDCSVTLNQLRLTLYEAQEELQLAAARYQEMARLDNAAAEEAAMEAAVLQAAHQVAFLCKVGMPTRGLLVC